MRFFSGLEEQEYVDDPNNIAIYDINTILKIDKSVKPYLLLKGNCAYERSDSNQEFREIKDFMFGDDLD